MLTESCDALVAFMKSNGFESISFVDTPDGIGFDPGIYYDDNVEDFLSKGENYEDYWDVLVQATFDALAVLHVRHPYRRLDGTFYLKDGSLDFAGSAPE